MKIIMITGGRDYDGEDHVFRVLDEMHNFPNKKIDLLVHGGATGADSLGAAWADRNGVQTCVFPVTKGQWDKVGKSAGPKRNRLMMDTFTPTFLVAFPGGRGTDGTVAIAKARKFKIRDERDYE